MKLGVSEAPPLQPEHKQNGDLMVFGHDVLWSYTCLGAVQFTICNLLLDSVGWHRVKQHV